MIFTIFSEDFCHYEFVLSVDDSFEVGTFSRRTVMSLCIICEYSELK